MQKSRHVPALLHFRGWWFIHLFEYVLVCRSNTTNYNTIVTIVPCCRHRPSSWALGRRCLRPGLGGGRRWLSLQGDLDCLAEGGQFEAAPLLQAGVVGVAAFQQ